MKDPVGDRIQKDSVMLAFGAGMSMAAGVMIGETIAGNHQHHGHHHRHHNRHHHGHHRHH